MQENHSFEDAYKRLESILKKLSSGETPLEDSLKLYEEADELISQCNKKLVFAEQKIEQLIKKRNGEVAVEAFE
ncbi:MAG: exodeoxyribonuclease VII small subunit [Simkaniaceae bacterium]|nr:exodeoxyribonuclease VII small subunit [Simkaniaceae bacterium]